MVMFLLVQGEKELWSEIMNFNIACQGIFYLSNTRSIMPWKGNSIKVQ